ncbi:MAG: hypothetical protein KUG81_01510 [Gammaproteobacteria bacterium]|nr:hypothetical protein [Gammaproteobacteria bacterium]
MSHYIPKRIRGAKLCASFIRSIAGILSRWPLLLLAAFLLSPIGPHLRWHYTYEQHGSYRHLLDCEYIGSRGLVKYRAGGECPVFAIIDQRKSYE